MQSFDMVLVDGRARIACLYRAVDKVAPGGALVLDNSDYERYQPALVNFLPAWRRRDFTAPGPSRPPSIGARPCGTSLPESER
jgi:hypothetical protein